MKEVGRYQIKSTLGQGGMATVYLAHDAAVGRDVAVKLLAARYLHHPAYRKRFEREARTVANLEHRAIVPLYDFGQTDGQPYLVMRLMRGGTAADSLMRKGAFDMAGTAAILRRIAPALDTAHGRGIIHRDLKPGNILFDSDGDAYLADFGVARLLTDYTTFTGSNEVIGTPAYMSPEMVQGKPIDHRSDLYALGTVIYKLLTGRAPFRASQPVDVAIQHVESAVPQIRTVRPDLPAAIQPFLEQAMAKKPDDRFQTAIDFYNAFAQLAPSFSSHVPLSPRKPAPPRASTLPPPPVRPADSPTLTNSLTIADEPPTNPAPSEEQLQTLPRLTVETQNFASLSSESEEETQDIVSLRSGKKTQDVMIDWGFDLTPRDALAQQVSGELMACIGCNDCMLACPLPETALVSIAELNFAIAETVITNPNVVEFVSACTQCQQCVPVCPADLSRADMVLWNKLKVEDVAPDRELHIQIGKQVAPSGWTADTLATHLAQFALFDGVSAADLRRTLFKSTLRKLENGDILVREGDYHERLFVILAGAVEQLVAGADDRQTRVIVLGAGSFHGEMAVLADQTEQFTVRAIDTSTVVEIPKAAVYQLMQLSPPFKQMMEGMYGQHAAATHLRQSPLLNDVSDGVVRDLLNAADLLTLPAGQTLLREGGRPDALYIVRSGFLRVSKAEADNHERVLVYFREADTFGAQELLTNGRNPFTVAANTRTELIKIGAVDLNRLLANNPAAKSAILRRAQQAAVPASQPQPKTAAPRHAHNTTQLDLSWTHLLDQGVLQGNEILVIDQNICTDCNNCVEGCGRRHGQSRLDRSGLQLSNLLFPTACRHCEDPVCLLCSVNGIVREPNGEISIVDDNCIGCGACADRCPYDNIKMYPRDYVQPKTGWLTSLWRSVTRQPFTQAIDLSHDVPQIAVKCDLCNGYDDYACVTACPVGAAFRIDPVKAFDISDMIIGNAMKTA